MAEKEKHTEEKIVDAAKAVFIEKGMAGARMQEIADKAGINKSLLHYYFRSKEKLFNFIFTKMAASISGMLEGIMKEGVPIEAKVKAFTGNYMDMLLKNPFLPSFIINELNRNPKALAQKFTDANIEPKRFFDPLKNQLEKEGYFINPHDFVINLLSLVIFPIVGRPIIEQKIFDGDSKAYKAYLKSRKESVAEFVMNALNSYKK
jgi:AcrR family transcriptional regulator